jgi:membrane protease YdiL (CAAX protease family)
LGGFIALLETWKPLLPALILPGILYALWWFFHDTWRELDAEATEYRVKLMADGESDYRPLVALALCAFILTMQYYYGGRQTYDQVVHPILQKYDVRHARVIRLAKYDDLYNFAWWSLTRVLGYVVVPLGVWRVAFPEDSILDMGLRTRGFFKHAWIYGLFLLVVLPAMLIVSLQPDFGAYYPFYADSSRSWYDFLSWEVLYFVQFFGLEIFFRGFWLATLRRSFGSGAIFAMAVPYCMIHYGKPFLEANGAILAGIALGSLSMRTRSIYQGFLVHITLAGLNDWLSLWHRHALPKVFWPPG